MLSERFEEALLFATRRHAGQVRKGTDVPYVSHLLSVCALVIEAGGDEDAAIGALLHDAVEDQKATLDEVRERFGAVVAAIVDQCSDTDEVPKPPWRARKEAFIASLAGMSAPARLVATADKTHNVRSILADYRRDGESVWEKFNGGREGSLWYYRAVCDALAVPGSRLGDLLRAAVDELETCAGSARS